MRNIYLLALRVMIVQDCQVNERLSCLGQPFHTNFNTIGKRIYFSSSQPKIKLTVYQETLIMKISAKFEMSIIERKDLEPL